MNPSVFAKIFTKFAALCIFLAAASAGVFASPVTYVYTGNVFNTFLGKASCAGSCDLTLSITLAAPLAGNLTLSFVTPLSFSVTGTSSLGTLTLNQGNSNPLTTFFGFSTDASGNIAGWFIDVVSSDATFDLATRNFGASGASDTMETTAAAFNLNDPGTWSLQSSTGATPEPSSLLLLGTGLLGVGAAFRRRLALS